MSQKQYPSVQDGVFGCKSKDEIEFFVEDAFARAGLDAKRGIKDNPLHQIYVSICSQLNDLMEQHAGKSGFNPDHDVSGKTPQEVAEIIIQQCIDNFRIFKIQQHFYAESDLWMRYLSVVQRGVQLGFAEAKDIVESLGGLNLQAKVDIGKLRESIIMGLARLRKA